MKYIEKLNAKTEDKGKIFLKMSNYFFGKT